MSILKINNANPGVKRPIKVEDLQDLWSGIQTALATGTNNAPRIICGFDVDTSGDYLTAGVIAFNEKLYVYDASTPILIGSVLYGSEVSTGDTRVMGDGTTQLFSYALKVTTTEAGNVRIGTAMVQNLEYWKRPLAIPAGYILTPMIADGAITEDQLANNSVHTGAIQDKAVTSAKIAIYAILADNIGNLAVTTDKIAGSAVTTWKIADEAVTFEKLKIGATNKRTVQSVNISGAGGTFTLSTGTILDTAFTTVSASSINADVDNLPKMSYSTLIVTNATNSAKTIKIRRSGLTLLNVPIEADKSFEIRVYLGSSDTTIHVTKTEITAYIYNL